MVQSIIGAVAAELARDKAEETARVIYFPARPCLGPDHPLEQTRKRREALEVFPWAPPAGRA